MQYHFKNLNDVFCQREMPLKDAEVNANQTALQGAV